MIENDCLIFLAVLGSSINPITEIIQDEYYLMVSSRSKYIKYWLTFTLDCMPKIDNENEVICFAYNSRCVITCDKNYEMR